MPQGLYGSPQPDLDALDQGADVPISPTDAYGQSFRDNAGDMTRRVLNFVGDHTVRAGAPQLSPDEANAKYGIEGQLRFNTPVTDNDAAFRHGEAVRQGYDAILNDRSGANPLLSMGATFAGSLVDPVGLGLMAATDGIAGVAKAGMGVGAAVDAGSVAARSGLIANGLAGAGRLAGTAAEGAALNLPFIGADAYLRHDVGDDMTMGEALQDLALGAVFHTGSHYLGEAFGRAGERAPAPDPTGEAPALAPESSPAFTPDAVADLPAQASNGAWLKAVDDMAGDESVDVARHVDAARNPDTLQGLDEASGEPAIPGRWGEDDTAVTPRGTEVPVRYGLVEMGDLATSHDDAFNVNPAYPPELQPRDRGRVGAMARNYQLEQELNPRLLMSDVNAAAGAPIVAPDGTVESGNGRTIALRRSAAQGRTDAYPRYVAALNEAGYDTKGMKQPMLVRARTEPLSGAMRANLAREMNADVTERMSAPEQAMADAQRISDEDLSKPMEGPADERAFHRAFLTRVAPDQINQLVGADGELSPEGVRRTRAALVARAYGDPRTVGALADPSSEASALLSRGLADAAPAWARMRAMAARGDIPPDVDLTANLNGAMDLVRQAKAAGMALDRFLAERLGQSDMFTGEAIAPETEAFLRLLYKDEAFKKPRDPGRIAWALREYARQATEVTPGPDLFGATADVSTARQILATVNERFATGDAGRIDLRAPGKAGDDDAASGAQPASRPPLVDLREPGGDRPDGGGEGLRPEGGEQAPGNSQRAADPEGGSVDGAQRLEAASQAVQAQVEQVGHLRDALDRLEKEAVQSRKITETRGQGVQYHGARSRFEKLQEGYYSPENIYGGWETFYTTDAADIASGYFRKNPNAALYHTREVSPVNHFDMEQSRSVQDWVDMLGKHWDDEDGFLPEALEVATGENGGRANLRQIMDEMRGLSRSYDLSKDDVQEYFDGIIQTLREQGYGGMSHVGGLQSNRSPHHVQIYFRPHEQLETREIVVPRDDVPDELKARIQTASQELVAANGKLEEAQSAEVEARAGAKSAATASADQPDADVQPEPQAPADPVAADPELKALADDTARLAAESGVAEEPTPETEKPATIAAAVRAAGQCLFEAADEVLG